MKYFRVRCPNCRRLYPVPVNENAFSCPKCRFPVRFVPSLEGTGWVVDIYREQADVQVVRSLDELIAGSDYRGGGRAVGAARARRMLRRQRKQRRWFRLSPLVMVFLCGAIAMVGVNLSLTNWLPQIPMPEDLIASLYLVSEPAYAAPVPSVIPMPTATPTAVAVPVTSPAVPTATPLPSPTPTFTATSLPPYVLQATGWHATVDAVIATSFAKETEHSDRQSITETAISARQTEWSGIRLLTATPKP